MIYPQIIICLCQELIPRIPSSLKLIPLFVFSGKKEGRGRIGIRWWRPASLLAECTDTSQAAHRAAASARQASAAGACSHASHTGTRSWREATRLAACTCASHVVQRYAASARQYTEPAAAPHESHGFTQFSRLVFPMVPPLTPPPASPYMVG